jgi:hypothetical protein
VYIGDMVSVDGVSGCSCVGDDAGYRPIVHFLLSFNIFHDEFVRSRAGLSSFPLCTCDCNDCCCQDIGSIFLIETYFFKESFKYR